MQKNLPMVLDEMVAPPIKQGVGVSWVQSHVSVELCLPIEEKKIDV